MARNNLKATVTADTSEYKKGIKEAKDATKSFEKDALSALNNVKNSFGVSTEALNDLINNIRNCRALFGELFRDADGGMSNLRKAIVSVGSALAGLGITAVVTAFKQLNSEADKFRETMSGQQLTAGAQALRDTYKQLANPDSASGSNGGFDIGQWWVNKLENIKTNASINLTNLFNNISEDDALKNLETAGKMAGLAGERAGIEYEITQNLSGQAVMLNRINTLSDRAKDKSLTQAEREDAKAQAINLTNIYYDRQIALQNRLVSNLAETNSIMKPTLENLQAQDEASLKITDLENKRKAALKDINGTSKSISSSAKATQQATELTLAAAIKLVEKERALKAIQDQKNAMKAAARFRMDGALPKMETPGNLQASANALTVPALIKPVVDTEAAQKAVVKLSSVIEQGVVGMSEALGDLIGNLINGENAWQGFAQAGIGVVADMLSTVGKAFVTEGVGVIAAQMALKTGNGPAAIAAGAAMIALAATMKTAMSNAAANWSGGSGAAVASSSYSSGTSAPSTYGREMVVRVTGTLTGEGSKLKAVINNDDRRNNVTT